MVLFNVNLKIGEIDNAKNNFWSELKPLGVESYSSVDGTNVAYVYIHNPLILPKVREKIDALLVLGTIAGYTVFQYPVDEIIDALKTHDYFKAFALCTSMYESVGRSILMKFLKKQNVIIVPDKAERISLYLIILMLHANKLINEPLYSDMVNVNEIRNKFIHYDILKNLTTDQANKIIQSANKIERSVEELLDIDQKTSS